MEIFTVTSTFENNTVSPYTDCTYKSSWDGFICSDTDIGMLQFESLDKDRWDRSVQPIFIFDGNGFYNVLNSYRDHYADSYTFS